MIKVDSTLARRSRKSQNQMSEKTMVSSLSRCCYCHCHCHCHYHDESKKTKENKEMKSKMMARRK